MCVGAGDDLLIVLFCVIDSAMFNATVKGIRQMTFKCHWVLNVLGILKKKATKAEPYCSSSYGGIGLCVKH